MEKQKKTEKIKIMKLATKRHRKELTSRVIAFLNIVWKKWIYDLNVDK